MTYESIISLAESMYRAETPRGIFAAEDESTRLYWMRRAVLRELKAEALVLGIAAETRRS